VLRLVETSYRDHCAYRTEADSLCAWIVCTSETVESLTAGIDSLSKEELEQILDKLDVIIVNNSLQTYTLRLTVTAVSCVFMSKLCYNVVQF